MLKTGHRTRYHLRAFEFLAARRRSRAVLTCTLLASFLATMPTGGLQAGDILRGGASAGNAKRNSEARANAGAAAAEAAKVRAQDRLARTTKAVNDMRALQASARAAAGANSIPNGLTEGGLKVLTGANAKWEGANAATASGNTVGITQTAAQALLHWDTFNVGSQTTLNFDQSAGGSDSGKWIAFNKVFDPAARPSEIRGKINAQGQVYIINQNGIIFGAGSQVNARTLVASALPINDNLVQSGLLNNKDSQFLFSKNFATNPAATFGDVLVERGALLTSPEGEAGNGGRVMLVGKNITNDGEIVTPSGQTILAAGLDIGIQNHAQDDPSLRGLDVWVGRAPADSGKINNTGLIEAKTGSILFTGREINQFGVLTSTTSVSLNGRIDLNASYGAVRNMSTSETAPQQFINQQTGFVLFGPGSVTRILPDFLNGKSIPGSSLPERSRLNILGQRISFEGAAMVQVPSGIVDLKAGQWPYRDVNDDGTTLGANGQPELGLASHFINKNQLFLFDRGIISLNPNSFIDVSGSTDVFVPLAHNILKVELRGTEFADSPTQRQGALRGTSLTIDARKSGVSNGRFWVGTPLGDVSGLVGLVEKNVWQLTAAGGSVAMQAGELISAGAGSIIDVSGGYFRNEGGKVRTSRLLAGNQILDIASATPDRVYDGVYTGLSIASHQKWGVRKTFASALAPTAERIEPSYLTGADGGQLSLIAPEIELKGELFGTTVSGPQQRSNPAVTSQLKLLLQAERLYSPDLPNIRVLKSLPQQKDVYIANARNRSEALIGTGSSLVISTDLFAPDGFGSVTISNPDGSISVLDETSIRPGGSLSLAAANISVFSKVSAPSGSLSFSAYNLSPSFIEEFNILNATLGPDPLPDPARGVFKLAEGGLLSVAGLNLDERNGAAQESSKPILLDGGSIFIEAFSADLVKGSQIDASGGVRVATRSGTLKSTYGKGGSISILTGRDISLPSVIGGSLNLGSELGAYSGTKGGSLSLRAQLIQIGGSITSSNTLLLSPAFFRAGGFTDYNLTGIGAPALTTPPGSAPTQYLPAIQVASGAIIEPVAENLILTPFPKGGGSPKTTRILKRDGERSPVSIRLTATGSDDDFTQNILEARGDIVVDSGAIIRTEAEGTIALKANTIKVLGSLIAPGGTISLQGSDRFPLARLIEDETNSASPTVVIGPQASISAAGTTILTPNSFGKKTGRVIDGGIITIYGNIVAAKGALIDVSGASDTLDVHPLALGTAISPLKLASSGLTSEPWARQTKRVQIDSNGGLIELEGSQMLLTDATLKGFAGGPTAIGGTLSIHSGKFYRRSGGSITGLARSTEINMVVQQSGDVIDSSNSLDIGNKVLDSTGKILTSTVTGQYIAGSRFSIDRFTNGGFDSLELGAKFLESSPNSPVAFGGNLEFVGPVNISAKGPVKLAGGGVISSNSDVKISAPYVAIGQPFRPPLNPSDSNIVFSQQIPGTGIRPFGFAPTSGTGSLVIEANLIDIGNLSLQSISTAKFQSSGDVRGSGTLAIKGDVIFQASQIYPTTLSKFDVFAYNRPGLAGSITIKSATPSAIPMSIGGSLKLFADTIEQAGNLRAPLGSITIGWDGITDYDTSDADIDPPSDSISLTELTAPVASSVKIASGSLTSVAVSDQFDRTAPLFPFGVSSDGLSWIDPRGIDITSTGLPEKMVLISGQQVTTETGSIIDIRGGGDLMATRWSQGIGGSIDRLGIASADWDSTKNYNAGDLVRSNGQTWSARVDSVGRKPSLGSYWSILEESFAVIPGYASAAAPYNAFNRGANSALLGGDPGYIFSENPAADRISTSLRLTNRKNPTSRIGDQIYVSSSPFLPEGKYTLLPRGYAHLPGAILITPITTRASAMNETTEGAFNVSGYMRNAFTGIDKEPSIRSRFEVAPQETFANRSQYLKYFGNEFFEEAASRLNLTSVQRLPIDAGYLGIHGNTGLSLIGSVLSTPPSGGRGASIDVSSLANIQIVKTNSSPPPLGTVNVSGEILSNWKPESLLIGGLRQGGASGTKVDVRTTNLTLNNSGNSLTAPDITLLASENLFVEDGSSIEASGTTTGPTTSFVLGQNGVAVRASGDVGARLLRTSVPTATNAVLSIGSGVRLSGKSLILDSTYSTSISQDINLSSDALTLGSGQISILFENSVEPLLGSIVPDHLIVRGNLLNRALNVKNLNLQSYRSIDVYGSGIFASNTLENLRFSASGIRAYQLTTQPSVFSASNITFENQLNLASVAAPTSVSGTISFAGDIINLGANEFAIAGAQNLVLNAQSGLVGTALQSQPGILTSQSHLTINAPLITGAQGTQQTISATGDLILQSAGVASSKLAPGLGTKINLIGQNIYSGLEIRTPSGQLTMRARTGDIQVAGALNAQGTEQRFFDVVKYTDGGTIRLEAPLGSISLQSGSSVSVASHAGGGNAGYFSASAPTGTATMGGTLSGSAPTGQRQGSAQFDIGSLASFSNLNTALRNGGFSEEINIRLRNNSISITETVLAKKFTLSVDKGDITIGNGGFIDARGTTGGSIALVARGSVTLESGSRLSVAAQKFSNAGKGGSIRLEAGAATDVSDIVSPNPLALLDIKSGSEIDLSVKRFVDGGEYVEGDYLTPGSSAFLGKFQGTLHLRARQNGSTDLRVNPINGSILNASSILVEGYQIFDLTNTGGLITNSGILNASGGIMASNQNVQGSIRQNGINFGSNIGAIGAIGSITNRLLANNPSLASVLVVAPGSEIINRTGDLILGTDADNSSNDWDLSSLRYGPKEAPGVLTLRAYGNLHFKNALSDGFAGNFSPNDWGETPPPGQELWLRPLMDIKVNTQPWAYLPVNTQSWSYRLSAGADLSASDFQRVRPLESLSATSGSVLVGKFYNQKLVEGIAATTGEAISNRFQVVRTGAGSIQLAAGRDVQLRNQFATIYTAGVRIPYSNTVEYESDVRLMSIFAVNDFAVPLVEQSTSHPDQGGLLGAFQQAYAAQYSTAGGDVSIFAQNDIGRFTSLAGQVTVDSSRQLPNNWLYRRGLVDPATSKFAESSLVSDRSSSTTWWVDFSNFFQGFGTLGGGDVSLNAGRDIINADAVAPTNARMAGLSAGIQIAPDLTKLLELGGGDVIVKAGRNIDGGVYYVERGQGSLYAVGEIKTNSARSPSLGLLGSSTDQPLGVVQSTSPSIFNSLTWLPTTLFAGKSNFNVSAGSNVLLGPTTNPFWLPQGVNNKFWYKTYFNTYSPDSGLDVSSFGGSVTMRLGVTLPGSTSSTPTLQAWLARHSGVNSSSAAWYEPWIRLSEVGTSNFQTISTVAPSLLKATAFAGDINIAGALNLYPSPDGGLELLASKGLIGLQPTGKTRLFLSNYTPQVTVWSLASLNVSDSDPNSFPDAANPLGYQSVAGTSFSALSSGFVDPFLNINPSFRETGSYTGSAAGIDAVRARHKSEILHSGSSEPVKLYALDGDITALTLFSPKASRIAASDDISDVSFYLQNTSPSDISIVTAGRDILPFNSNSKLQTLANDIAKLNFVSADSAKNTITKTSLKSLQGDIQINGPGVLQVIAGRNIDLGTGPAFSDGTGSGITSIGNRRNLFLPISGADLIILSGVTGRNGGAALGLTSSSLKLDSLSSGAFNTTSFTSAYLKKASLPTNLSMLTPEQLAIVALEEFFSKLKAAGRESIESGSYESGFAAIAALVGDQAPQNGRIFTRGRDIRSTTGGAVTMLAPGGDLTLPAEIVGNPLTPPGIVTEYGGAISIFTNGSVDLGRGRIFTLRGGDITIWSSTGDIAAGTAPKNEVTAPPTRIVFDSTSADVKTDPGGLATGGGIGVLASVEGVVAGDVDLIAPAGVVDAGDAGIRSTGNLNIAATAVLNAGNIAAGGSSAGVPTTAPAAAPNIGGLTSGSSSSVAASNAAQSVANQSRPSQETKVEEPSIIVVEVLGYGGGDE